MITKLKPYTLMKASGIDWLGEIPEHWNVKRGKYIFVCIDKRSETGEEELLTVSGANGVIPRRSTKVTMFKAESYVGHKLCWPNDLVINSLWAWGRGLGFANHHGIVSTAYGVYRLRTPREASPRYLHLLVRSQAYHWELRVRSRGIWISRLQLTDEAFLDSKLPLPPPQEQEAIVRYLNNINRRIKQLVRSKRKLISLLTEQKQVIINKAVTSGLDPNVSFKEANSEWLEQLPQHWEIARLKDAAVVQTGITLGKNYKSLETNSYPYLRVANVQAGRVDLRKIKRVNVPKADAQSSTLKAGDVLITEGGDIDKLGRGCVWHDEIPGCLHQNHVFAVRCKPDLLEPDFLSGLLASQYGRIYFELTAKKTTNLASTNSTTVRAFPIMLPPISEQKTILKEIDNQSAALNKAQEDAENEIELLNKLLSRLINDVVTGKLDVREAAANLPEVDQLAEAGGSIDDTLDLEADSDEFHEDLEEVEA